MCRLRGADGVTVKWRESGLAVWLRLKKQGEEVEYERGTLARVSLVGSVTATAGFRRHIKGEAAYG